MSVNAHNIDLNPPLFPKGWLQMDLIDRRKSQFFGDYESSTFVDLVTVQDNLIETNKTFAAQVSFQEVCNKMEFEMQRLRNQRQNEALNPDEYESDTNSYMGDVVDDTVATPNHHYEYDKMNSWLSSLRYNYIFDSGFSESYRSLKPLADSCCCPCSSTTKLWREQFGLNILNKHDKCCTSKLFTPGGLVAHLRTKSNNNCLLHLATYEYLKKLYPSHAQLFPAVYNNRHRHTKKKKKNKIETLDTMFLMNLHHLIMNV